MMNSIIKYSFHTFMFPVGFWQWACKIVRFSENKCWNGNKKGGMNSFFKKTSWILWIGVEHSLKSFFSVFIHSDLDKLVHTIFPQSSVLFMKQETRERGHFQTERPKIRELEMIDLFNWSEVLSQLWKMNLEKNQ